MPVVAGDQRPLPAVANPLHLRIEQVARKADYNGVRIGALRNEVEKLRRRVSQLEARLAELERRCSARA